MNNLKIQVRLGTTSHIEALIPLVESYINFYNVTPPVKENLFAHIKKICTNSELGVILIAENKDKDILGFAIILKTLSTFKAKQALLLDALFVSPKYRKQGVAQKLMHACKEFYNNGDYSYIEWMTAPDNISARRLYKRCGAKENDWIVCGF